MNDNEVRIGELLRVEEVALRLNLCAATVNRKIKSGELRAVRLGKNCLRVSERALAEYLKNNGAN